MTLIVHHLQRSQSEPIVWLCEELGLQYELKIYRRKQKREGLGAPPELKALHPCGTAPIIQDASITLAETGAIIEYLLARYGNDRLRVQPDAPNFTSCIFWYHWAIVSLQLVTKLPISLRKAGVQWSSPQMQEGIDSIASALHLMDARLKKAPFLAGDEITAADIYAVFSVTTLRLFVPFALTGYDGLLGWLKRASKRPAYKAMFPTLCVEAPRHITTF
ncbi:glutathione S-transferase like protein [Macrophomina phaseolina]|uniref:Glutathione S-transferase like protein n=1 Tax=Macrophomina phaseolina TaxID=35725 RepID=A0ABQ8GF92_9PEZI|nr:glutathione S-transferase like protein [Macrophomina phaseolina]